MAPNLWAFVAKIVGPERYQKRQRMSMMMQNNGFEQWRTPVEMVAVSAKRVSLPPTAQPAGGEAAEGDAAQAQRARFDAATKGEEHMLAAAAAAQNIMLSLAGEQIGARWCLPRVARTKAFAVRCGGAGWLRASHRMLLMRSALPLLARGVPTCTASDMDAAADTVLPIVADGVRVPHVAVHCSR